MLFAPRTVLACSYGFESWPKLRLFVKGAAIDRLIESVRAGDVDKVRAILRVRPELVNREAPSSHGYTALHYAVLERMPDMVRILLRSGADPHVSSAGIYALRYAATPMAIATERGYEEITSALRQEERQRETGAPAAATSLIELRCAFDTGDEDQVLRILNHNPTGRCG